MKWNKEFFFMPLASIFAIYDPYICVHLNFGYTRETRVLLAWFRANLASEFIFLLGSDI